MKKLSVRAVCLEVCLLLAIASNPAQAQTGVVRSVPANGDLQAALDAAVAGDIIQLAVGATYTGNFVLTPKAGAAWITIRTAPDSRQPAAGVRVGPAHAPALARIISPNSMPAIRTVGAAHHFRLVLLELGPNNQGFGEILQLGQADSQQTSLSQVPYSLSVDRVYIHGDPVAGQKRGIALNSASTDIVNCYISDIKAIGQDAQAIAAMNGPGPYLIQNNYLEAAAENFLTGGVDPPIPNLTPSDITFRYNHLSKPVAWRYPIVPAPALVAAATSSAGSLGPGTYAYRVVAYRLAGQGISARSAASAEVSTSLDATGAVSVNWAAVPNATSYRVYGRVPGGATQYWTTTGTSFLDTGAAGTAGTPGSGTLWTVKNLFELKNARRVLVERNTMEYNWAAAQAGYGVVFTPRNSSGACTWCAVEDVLFRLNIVRHVAAGVNILGYDNTAPSGQARRITIRDNLFYDVNKTAWAGNGWAVMVGDGPADIVIDHNTIDHDGTSVIYAYGASASGVQVTNNLMRHGSYGIFGSSTAYGMATIDGHFPGGVVTSNVLAGGSASRYPAGNLFPTVAAHLAQFMAPASGDYRLVAGSSYAGAALDGTDLGANIAEINSATQQATRGASSSMTAAVAITTTELPRGTVGTPMAATVSAASGGAPVTWSLTGSLPDGVTFDAGTATFSGVPAEYGTWPVQVTAALVTDPANSATRALGLSVWPLAVTVPSTRLAVQTLGRQTTMGVSATGGTGSYRWRVVDGAVPPGVTLGELTGAFSGTPTQAGTFAFTVEAADVTYPDLTGRGSDVVDVVPAQVTIVAQTLARGTQGVAYGATLDATGGAGAIVWSVATGSLPPGLTLSSDGSIAGTPASVGSWNFGVRAADSLYPSNSATATLALAIAPAPLQIVTTKLPEPWRTLPYSTRLTATGGTGAITWRVSAGTLPLGLTLSTTGVLSGATKYTGSYTFTVEARDSGAPVQTATRQYTVICRTKDGR